MLSCQVNAMLKCIRRNREIPICHRLWVNWDWTFTDGFKPQSKGLRQPSTGISAFKGNLTAFLLNRKAACNMKAQAGVFKSVFLLQSAAYFTLVGPVFAFLHHTEKSPFAQEEQFIALTVSETNSVWSFIKTPNCGCSSHLHRVSCWSPCWSSVQAGKIAVEVIGYFAPVLVW